MESKNFGGGLGIDVHIRTKIKDDWSYINSSAIKIGQDVFEIGAFGKYYLNGVEHADLTGATLSGFPIVVVHGGVKELDGKKFEMKLYEYLVDMGDKGKIFVKATGPYMAVMIHDAKGEHFSDALGLMGNYENGDLDGRDGKTNFHGKPNKFGLEWQVRDMETMLFHEAKGPQ